MTTTPALQRAPEEEIVAWIRGLNDLAVKLTDNMPQTFEVRKIPSGAFSLLRGMPTMFPDWTARHGLDCGRKHFFRDHPVQAHHKAEARPLDDAVDGGRKQTRVGGYALAVPVDLTRAAGRR